LDHAGLEEFLLAPLLSKLKEGDVGTRQSRASLGCGRVAAAGYHRLLLSSRLTQLGAVFSPCLTLSPRLAVRLINLPLCPSGIVRLSRRATSEQTEKGHNSHKSY